MSGFDQSKRNFLGMTAKLLAGTAVLGSVGCVTVRSHRIDRLIERHKAHLSELDSFVGENDLEGVFQREYDKFTNAPELRVRSAPGTTQLPYHDIVRKLRLSDSNPLVMLYPGAALDAVTVLFGHLAHQYAPNVPVKIISTEIKDEVVLGFKTQLNFLQKMGVLEFTDSERKTTGLTEVNFNITTSTGRFNVVYRIRPKSDEYFTAEDAKEANIIRELHTFDGNRNLGFIAEIAQRCSTDDRPILITLPDYDRLGAYYTMQMNEGIYDYGNRSIRSVDRYITHDELVALEARVGPRGISSEWGNMSFRNSPDRPIRDFPGEVNLSRGYVACSCNPCMHKFAKHKDQIEKLRYNHTVLYYPDSSVKLVSQDALIEKLKPVFDCASIAAAKNMESTLTDISVGR